MMTGEVVCLLRKRRYDFMDRPKELDIVPYFGMAYKPTIKPSVPVAERTGCGEELACRAAEWR